MKSSLTPKELAQAIGVSESSLKRWVDDGVLAAARTPGGHRRIPLTEAIRFIRATHATVVRPELLGLGDVGVSPNAVVPLDELAEQLYQALYADDHVRARGLVLAAFLAGTSIASLGDGPMRRALARIGEMWEHDANGIMIEHRATDICCQTLHILRSLLPQPAPHAPGALGGAPPGDPYLLPSLMVATVLHEAGYRELNLGPETPTDTLQCAIRRYEPRLVWLSISVAVDPAHLLAKIDCLATRLAPSGSHLVLGGRGLLGRTLPAYANLHVVGTLAELITLAQEIERSRPPAPVP